MGIFVTKFYEWRRPVSPASEPDNRIREARSAMPELTCSGASVRPVLGDSLSDLLSSTFDLMDWAEDEIEKSQRRHPEHADALYHSFRLLAPSAILQKARPAEFVYRSHCRELLERVAKGEDTRPATNAEIVCMCAEASQITPLNTAATGLYMRMWNRAFPGMRNAFREIDDSGHYEAIAGSGIDACEEETRRKLTVKDRTLAGEDCPGRHHGKPAPGCLYYTGDAQAA